MAIIYVCLNRWLPLFLHTTSAYRKYYIFLVCRVIFTAFLPAAIMTCVLHCFPLPVTRAFVVFYVFTLPLPCIIAQCAQDAILSPSVAGSRVSCDDNEYRLIRDLMRNYDPRVRPSLNASESLNVTFGLALAQIIDVVSTCFIIRLCSHETQFLCCVVETVH